LPFQTFCKHSDCNWKANTFKALRCVASRVSAYVYFMVWAKQHIYFENATACSKRMLKTTVATYLKGTGRPRAIFLSAFFRVLRRLKHYFSYKCVLIRVLVTLDIFRRIIEIQKYIMIKRYCNKMLQFLSNYCCYISKSFQLTGINTTYRFSYMSVAHNCPQAAIFNSHV